MVHPPESTPAFTDSDGTETKVKAGDIAIARMGDSHALASTGSEPFIFLDGIGQKQAIAFLSRIKTSTDPGIGGSLFICREKRPETGCRGASPASANH